MKLKVLRVHNHGDHKKEYVIMEVVENCNIGRYMLADSTYVNPGQASDKLRHVYWLPNKQVKKGERVTGWTKPGSSTTVINKADYTIHRLFWGLSAAVWNDEGDCAVLFHLQQWKFFEVE